MKQQLESLKLELIMADLWFCPLCQECVGEAEALGHLDNCQLENSPLKSPVVASNPLKITGTDSL